MKKDGKTSIFSKIMGKITSWRHRDKHPKEAHCCMRKKVESAESGNLSAEKDIDILENYFIIHITDEEIWAIHRDLTLRMLATPLPSKIKRCPDGFYS